MIDTLDLTHPMDLNDLTDNHIIALSDIMDLTAFSSLKNLHILHFELCRTSKCTQKGELIYRDEFNCIYYLCFLGTLRGSAFSSLKNLYILHFEICRTSKCTRKAELIYREELNCIY